MIQARCIKKHKDWNDNIKQYVLMDNQGTTKILSSEEIKQAIMQKQIIVTNLTLTSDGRLINKSSKVDVPEEVTYLTCIKIDKKHPRYWYKLQDLSGTVKNFSEQLLGIAMVNNMFIVDNLWIHMGRVRYKPTQEQTIEFIRAMLEQKNDNCNRIKQSRNTEDDKLKSLKQALKETIIVPDIKIN